MEKLSRDRFKYYINFIKDRIEVERKLNDMLSKEFVDSTLFLYSKYEIEFINLLKDIMNDISDWIGYFIYELDFGKRWEPGTVTEKDGVTDVPLATIDDLYNILTEEIDVNE